MEDIKKIIDEFSIAALEADTKIAGVAVISDFGDVIYQSENFNLKNQSQIIVSAFKGKNSFKLNKIGFNVLESSSEALVANSEDQMGYVIIYKLRGGFFVVYAMPGGDPESILGFLKKNASKLQNLF
ncbi:MAG: hypothetical protein BAJALOKI2v1_100062 [Promethearchaeota archaeon]|nr:MAG: hypothetical protein BAJALOKI2v1_100062 [Candidatus Lokiarchaeota archaeon]